MSRATFWLSVAAIAIGGLSAVTGLTFVFVAIWSTDDRWAATAMTCLMTGIMVGGGGLVGIVGQSDG